MNKNNLIKSILALVFIVAAFLFLINFDFEDKKTVNTSNWDVFESEEYDFEISYPSEDWNYNLEPDYLISPRFNFYIKPQGVAIEEAFDHFANITNVSVFPEGIPTEGLMGKTEPLEENWGDNIDNESTRVYTLEDGTPFAAYVRFKEIPNSWEEWGYAWVRLRVENMEAVCFEDGVRTNKGDQCDPLGNESISIGYEGEVNKELWPVLIESLKSINFTDNRSDTTSVNIFYYNPELDTNSEGNLLCSDAGLVSLEREVESGDLESVIENTINLLISGDLRGEDVERGIETEFPLDEFSLQEISLVDGVLSLTFDDPNFSSSGGSCRVGILQSQLIKTLEQFDEVERIELTPDYIFQP